jgi:hypothetical protein
MGSPRATARLSRSTERTGECRAVTTRERSTHTHSVAISDGS